MSLLAVNAIGISFGGLRAVDSVSFACHAAQIFAIIGPNGAGKTTLFNLISGVYRSDSGSVHLSGQDVSGLAPAQLAMRGLARTFQNLQIFFRMSVIENVMVGAHSRERRSIVPHLLGTPATWRENRRSREEAMGLLSQFKLSELAERTAGSLAYGQLKRLEIARALASRPTLLLLDEPAAGCNASEIAELDQLIVEIAKSGVAVLLVEHNMKLVMGVSNRVLVLAEGRKLMEGTPGEVANSPVVIEAYLGTDMAGAEVALG